MSRDFQLRIVCAANKYKYTLGSAGGSVSGEVILLGVRHWDGLMRQAVNHMDPYIRDIIVSKVNTEEIQGFVDNRGNFLTRKEAYVVAKAANQIIEKTGNPHSEELYSEDYC